MTDVKQYLVDKFSRVLKSSGGMKLTSLLVIVIDTNKCQF
jgi:hypothetical protein